MNTALNISLPETLTSYINQRIAEEKKLEQQLLEGINSPAAIIAGSPEWDDFWENLSPNTQAA